MRFTRASVGACVLPAGKSEAIVFDEVTPGFGLRLRAGGKRTWVVQYRVGTKQRRLTLGSTVTVDLDEARRRAKAALGKVAPGTDPQTEKADARARASVTLAATAEDYLLRRAEKRLKPGSLAEVKRHLRQHWKPLGERPIASISRAHVSARLAEIARDHGPFAANRARAALSSLFSWSIGEGFVDDNPVIGTHRPTEEVARDRVLSDSEVALVWRHAGAADYGAIGRLLLLTACRREEVAAIAWSELDGDVWSIPGQRTKNGLPLSLALPPLALDVLRDVQTREGRDLVFGSRAGPFSGWSKAKAELDTRMLAALKAERGARAALQPWRLHDLRRIAATRMADLGVQPHIVESVLNHLSGTRAGVAGIYNRAAYAAEKRAALAVWADRVAELIGADRR